MPIRKRSAQKWRIIMPVDKPSSAVTAAGGSTVAVIAPPPERLNFKTLILSNPNHFGTFPKLGPSAVLLKASDTFYEEMTCLGLNPQQNKLEAVVQIKQHNGYITDACGPGSREYVRFFVQHG